MEKINGKFITLEGVEGCGKTTQQKELVSWLEARGVTCISTKQPGGSAIGKKIREILLHKDSEGMTSTCEALLYLADRAQHHEEVIMPALKNGTWIVCDRYQDSTRAYQGAARGMDPNELDRIFQLATNGLKPDLTFLLDLDPEVGLLRARKRLAQDGMAHAEGRFEDEHLRFHQAVRKSFLSFAEEEPERFVIIDAKHPREAVTQNIHRVLEERGILVR